MTTSRQEKTEQQAAATNSNLPAPANNDKQAKEPTAEMIGPWKGSRQAGINDKLMCYPLPPFQCDSFREYVMRQMQARKNNEPQVLGRPPHDAWCPKSCPVRARSSLY